MKTINRIALVAVLITVVATLWVFLAPEFSSDPIALPQLREARRDWFGFFWPTLIGLLMLGGLTGLVLAIFSRLGRRETTFAEVWGKSATLSIIVLVPLGFMAVALTQWSAMVRAPESALQGVIISDGLTVNDRYLAHLDNSVTLDRNSRLSPDGLIFDAHTIWSLTSLGLADGFLVGSSAPQVTRVGRAPISDAFLRSGNLFWIEGRELFGDGEGGRKRIAILPAAGMRFGQIKQGGGTASAFLVYGGDGPTSFLYELRSDGHYTKLLNSVGAPIVGAGTCYDRTYVAYHDRVVSLWPGFKPRLSFRAPKGQSIRSILVYQTELYSDTKCLLLVATDKTVFSVQGGLAILLIAGIGGNLGASEEENLGFTLVDPARGAVLEFSFKHAPPQI